MEELKKLQISLPANLRYSALIRNVANEIFGFVKFDKTWCSRLKLVVDELFMNAVRYGSTEDKSVVHIQFEYNDSKIQFTIEDDGTGPKSTTVEELRKKVQSNQENTDPSKTHGRGLSMITNLWTDEMRIEKSEYGGIKISFAKSLGENKEISGETPEQSRQPVITVSAAQANSETPSTETSKPSMPLQKEVKVSGEIDQSNIANVINPVNDQVHAMPEGSTLILDFSELKYINSLFIGQLAGWYTTMKHKNGQIQIKNLNEEVKGILEMVGLLKLIPTS